MKVFSKISHSTLKRMISFNHLSMKFFSTTPTKTNHGGLKDQDRIFTNLYKDGDPFIEGAMKRVRKHNIILIGRLASNKGHRTERPRLDY